MRLLAQGPAVTLPPLIEGMNASHGHHDDHERECRSRHDECRDEGTVENHEREHGERRAHDADAQHPIHKGSVRGIRANTLPRDGRRGKTHDTAQDIRVLVMSVTASRDDAWSPTANKAGSDEFQNGRLWHDWCAVRLAEAQCPGCH
jgi:hypothetical protein